MKIEHLLLILTPLLVTAATAQNPFQPKKETMDAIQKISFLTGNWKGTGWIQMGPQKSTFNQTENISVKVNGTIIQIDGQGKDQQKTGVVIHQAFAIISYDIENSKYLMKAFRGDGEQIDAEAKLIDDHSFQWDFSNAMTGQIKYTITVINNKWTETGEMSTDKGKNWFKYFEMVLDKQ
ncbi:MAG TPA: hypothetical protein VMI12_04815 [Puia sp.]|nr:hypothetical protein [Puia sp.]